MAELDKEKLDNEISETEDGETSEDNQDANEKAADSKKQAKTGKDVKKASKDIPSGGKKNKDKIKFSEKVKRFLREYRSELKKIIWYGPKQTFKSTVLVVITLVIAAAVIGVLDYTFSNILTTIGRII